MDTDSQTVVVDTRNFDHKLQTTFIFILFLLCYSFQIHCVHSRPTSVIIIHNHFDNFR